MSNQSSPSPSPSTWWRWLALPFAVVLGGCVTVGLGVSGYLLLFDLLCPSTARFDSSCYSDGVLLTEKVIILAIAGLSGFAVIWSGYLATPRAPFLTAQWLALLGFVASTLVLLALDWDMWPLYSAFLAGLGLALVGIKYHIRGR